MLKFRDFPIKKKLNIIILFMCGLTLLLTSAVYLSSELASFRRDMIHNILTLAKVVGSNSTAAVIYQDTETAEEILTALNAEQHILYACIYTMDNSIFASYINHKTQENRSTKSIAANLTDFTKTDQFSKLLKKQHFFSNKYLDLIRPIKLKGRQIGMVYIRADLKGLYFKLKLFGYIAAAILIGTFSLAYFMSSKLHKVISKPIADLAHTIKKVAINKNYSVRAQKGANDEIGILINGFNEMLKQIQQRDKKLEKLVVESEKARAIAEAASLAKSDFLANMSHELRTPLNHIIGFTELVVDKLFGDLNETQEEYLNDSLSSSRHLLSLINDILDLSKVESGKMELELGDVHIISLLENSITMVKEKALKHNILLSSKISDIPEYINADERKLKQILYNLLSNAVKFTKENGKVFLTATVVDDDDDDKTAMAKVKKDNIFTRQNADALVDINAKAKKFIKISVKDTGIGLKKEDQERIFRPFEQADSSNSRQFEGTGLGLSLTKKLVELHGGSIGVVSEGENMGSTFAVFVPA